MSYKATAVTTKNINFQKSTCYLGQFCTSKLSRTTDSKVVDRKCDPGLKFPIKQTRTTRNLDRKGHYSMEKLDNLR